MGGTIEELETQSDEFEQVLDFCVEKIYRSLKKEREYLWEKLIDRAFGNDISKIITELYVARADIRTAYRTQKRKQTNK